MVLTPRSNIVKALGALGLLMLAAHPAQTFASIPAKSSKTTVTRTYVQVAVDVHAAVDQHTVGSKACGPASVLNALIFGNRRFRAACKKIEGKSPGEKLAALIEKWGETRSGDYGKGNRWRSGGGVSPHDLRDMINDALGARGAERLTGRFLDRTPGEDPGKYVKRVHASFRRSLEKGVPVIVSLRSFAPDRTGKNESIVWNGLGGHYVLLYKVPESLEAAERGFSFEYLDPNGPKIGTGYIYFEGLRNFTAAKGNSEKWIWLKDSPFLLVNAPSLNTLKLQKQKWYWRTIVTLNHAIGALD